MVDWSCATSHDEPYLQLTHTTHNVVAQRPTRIFFSHEDILSYFIESGFITICDVIALAQVDNDCRKIARNVFRLRISAIISRAFALGSSNNYGVDVVSSFLCLLHRTGGLVGGQAALKIMQFPSYAWQPVDIEIFVGRGSWRRWHMFLRRLRFRQITSDLDVESTRVTGASNRRVYEPLPGRVLPVSVVYVSNTTHL